jgi:UDP-3-O-[3-hydroxymyristoyl] glucosamine N-acyltransferase
MRNKFNINDFRDIIKDGKILGSSFCFEKLSTLDNADSTSLIWIASNRNNFLEIITSTDAKVIICDKSKEADIKKEYDKCFVLVDNPKLIFMRISKAIYENKTKALIHPTSFVHEEAIVSSDAYIGPNCTIGKCIVGEKTIIVGNTFINDNVVIGKNVFIGANCSIGLDGFGYETDENGNWEKFPHIGGVIIKDNVSIGSNTCIDRGTIGDTIINQNVKIDNLVHVAHNVNIGSNTLVIANSMIGGSTHIEENCWIAPSSTLRDGLRVGNNSTVGMGAVVTKNIAEKEVWFGNPAKKR